MNPTTILVGVVAIGYGIYTAWARSTRPEQFKKLKPMKEFWGERRGAVIHTIGYTVVPIVFGIAMIASGLKGGSLF